MNGQTLSPDHGYPLRVVVPGVTGARWVKWIDQITITDDESPNFYQQRDYRILPPHVESAEQATDYWAKIPSIQSLPVNSIIASVTPDIASPEARIVVKGYAMGAGGACGRIAKVQVSADDGETWQDARITYQEGKWSWTLWACTIDITALKERFAEEREIQLLSRAQDENGDMQKRECDWNFRGVAFNAYGKGVWRW
jgi:sulfite oxidase